VEEKLSGRSATLKASADPEYLRAQSLETTRKMIAASRIYG